MRPRRARVQRIQQLPKARMAQQVFDACPARHCGDKDQGRGEGIGAMRFGVAALNLGERFLMSWTSSLLSRCARSSGKY